MLKMHLSACNNSKKKKIGLSPSPCHRRKWSELPRNVLFDIMGRLAEIDDYVRFGAVCVSWLSVIVEDKNSSNKKRGRSQPFLLIASPDVDKHRMVMYSLSRNKIYNFDLHLPDDNNFCRGSSFGWLVTLQIQDMNNFFAMLKQNPYSRNLLKDTNKYSVQLQNPFLPRDRIINLPPLDTLIQRHPDLQDEVPHSAFYLWKAVLSSDPLLSDDFVVVAIMSRFCGLAFFKSGNKDWISIGNWQKDWELDRIFEDVIFSRKTKQFYALRMNKEVLIIDLEGGGGQPNLTQLMPPTNLNLDDEYPLKMCLVEDLSSGELLQVHKYDNEAIKSYYFVVFKLDGIKKSWVRIHNLADKVMFLGNNNSVVCSASDCPGCKPNCVYFTEDFIACFPTKRGYGPPHDGIYSFEDNAVQPHYSIRPSDKKVPPSIWIDPTLI